MAALFVFALLLALGLMFLIRGMQRRRESGLVKEMGLRTRAWMMIVLAVIWAVALTGPLLYSRLHPNEDIQRVLYALSRQELFETPVQPPLTEIFNSDGRLKRAIQVGASWQSSADLNAGESHSTRENQASYLAWFENRSTPTILTITRIDVDHSYVRFRVGEGNLLATVLSCLAPFVLLGIAVYLLRSR